jgi:hypothetical protein
MPIRECDAKPCGARFERLVFLTAQAEAGRLPGVREQLGQQAALADRLSIGVGHREGSLLGCRHDQHLRDYLIAGRAPAG